MKTLKTQEEINCEFETAKNRHHTAKTTHTDLSFRRFNLFFIPFLFLHVVVVLIVNACIYLFIENPTQEVKATGLWVSLGIFSVLSLFWIIFCERILSALSKRFNKPWHISIEKVIQARITYKNEIKNLKYAKIQKEDQENYMRNHTIVLLDEVSLGEKQYQLFVKMKEHCNDMASFSVMSGITVNKLTTPLRVCVIDGIFIIEDIQGIIANNPKSFFVVIPTLKSYTIYEAKNPYYLTKEVFDSSEIKFQTKGHSHNKKVVITLSQSYAVFTDAVFEFYLWVNEHKFVPEVLSSKYDKESHSLTLQLPHVHHHEYDHKTVELRYVFGNLKIRLPKPEIFEDFTKSLETHA